MDNNTLLVCCRVSKEWASVLDSVVSKRVNRDRRHYDVISANVKTNDVSALVCYMRKHWDTMDAKYRGRLRRYIIHRFTIWKPGVNFYPLYAHKMMQDDLTYICGNETARLLLD